MRSMSRLAAMSHEISNAGHREVVAAGHRSGRPFERRRFARIRAHLAVHAASWLPGLLLCVGLAAAALGIGQISALNRHGVSALALAIVLGMLVGNLSGQRLTSLAPGIDFARQRLLRLGVMLYGLRLTLQDVAQVGLHGVLIDVVMLGSTFLLACVLGRWLKVDRATTLMVGAGGAICGAAAVMATQPVVRARSEQVAVAVATVVVFGTVATFLYPQLHVAMQGWGWRLAEEAAFGVYVGSTVHEVAQVVAASNAVGSAAADTAVVSKMVRVMLLAPFLLLLSMWVTRGARSGASEPGHADRIAIPWFALGFVAVVAINSLSWLPPAVVDAVIAADTVILATAMAALGVSTRVAAVRQAGLRPLLLAGGLFAWLVVGGASVNLVLPLLMGQ